MKHPVDRKRWVHLPSGSLVLLVSTVFPWDVEFLKDFKISDLIYSSMSQASTLYVGQMDRLKQEGGEGRMFLFLFQFRRHGLYSSLDKEMNEMFIRSFISDSL